MLKIGVTGGIGSGKSTLCNHFVQSGVALYNSDRRAKELMTSDKQVIKELKALFGDEAYTSSGELNKAYITQQIFFSEEKLEVINSIVHPAVKRDFLAWADMQSELTDQPYVILESALIFDSEIEDVVDKTVAVLAPMELRVMRVVNRDGITQDEAEARILVQLTDDEFHERADYSVVNIIEEDLAGAAQRLDQIFKKLASDGVGA
ncbi:MAG: dephospho-CoA kinase [Rikenellaceae bacterium]